MWPFNRSENRESSYSDALIQQILSSSGGSVGAAIYQHGRPGILRWSGRSGVRICQCRGTAHVDGGSHVELLK